MKWRQSFDRLARWTLLSTFRVNKRVLTFIFSWSRINGWHLAEKSDYIDRERKRESGFLAKCTRAYEKWMKKIRWETTTATCVEMTWRNDASLARLKINFFTRKRPQHSEEMRKDAHRSNKAWGRGEGGHVDSKRKQQKSVKCELREKSEWKGQTTGRKKVDGRGQLKNKTHAHVG